ncbi:O-antigen ligase [Achromobacter sp. DH1f]|uniref:O-antigen ligase family protein n=1 Tax=Achromobacter sp. DH1f TaxID=1397275 RepID=UPI00046AA1DA|nr:O-antigen ligase family protein [Achromobacter sp. DH1f]
MPQICLRTVVALALLMPALALTSAVGGPAIIYLTSVIALVVLGVNAFKRREPFAFRELTPMAAALTAPALAMLISSVYLGIWSSSEIEKLLRFVLAVPVCWVLLRAPRNWLQQIQWSLLFGAFAGSIMLLVIVYTPGLGRTAVSEFGGLYNAVAFADLTMFFGLASCLTLPWKLSPWPRVEAGLKMLVVPLTIYAVWASQTRSSWALLVVLGFVCLATKRQWTMRIKLIFVGAMIAVLAAVALVSWYSTESRWRVVVTDVNNYAQDERDTSVGIRIQLWKASWLMFKESPIVGVGGSSFRAELAKLEEQGVVTKLVSTDFGEPHNDMLGALAGYGALGLLSILALYLIPAAVFWRRSRSNDPAVHIGSQIGMLFCLGYFTFSLSEMMFRNMRSVPIYALIVVVLYALTSARTGLAQQRLAAAKS